MLKSIFLLKALFLPPQPVGPASSVRQLAEQLCDILSNYGGAGVTEVLFGGACGERPNGIRQVYDWPLFHRGSRGWHARAWGRSGILPIGADFRISDSKVVVICLFIP